MSMIPGSRRQFMRFAAMLVAAVSSVAHVGALHAQTYTWNGTDSTWNSTNWFDGVSYVAGPTLDTDAAIINSGQVTFSASDTFGDAAIATSPAITVGGTGTLASGGFFNTFVSPTLSGGTLLLNGGGNANYGAFGLKGTVTVNGSAPSNINVGGGSFNTINIGPATSAGSVTFDVANVTGNATSDLNVNATMRDGRSAPGPTVYASGLIKTGNGTMTLSAANTYTGTTTINAGVLALNHPDALGGGGIVTFTGGTLQYDISNTFQFGGLIENSTSAIRINTNGFTIGYSQTMDPTNVAGLTKLGSGTLNLTALNSYSGATNINAGTLGFIGSGTISTASTINVNNGTRLYFGRSNTFGNHLTTTSSPIVIAQGGLVENGEYINTLVDLTLNGGELRANGGSSAAYPAYLLKGTVTAGGSSASLISANNSVNDFNTIQLGNNTAGGVTVFNVANATGDSSADLTVSAVLINGRDAGNALVASGLTKNGTGTLSLSAANTYTGATTINAGTLAFTPGGTIATASTINVNDGGTLLFNRGDTWGNAYTTTSAPIVIAQGGLVENGARFNTLVDLTLNGGELRANGGANTNYQAYQLKGTVTAGGSSASLISANTSASANNTIQLGNNTEGGVTVFNVADATGDSSADLTVSAVLTNGRNLTNTGFVASGLTKNGTGTLLLSGNNTYTGATTVNAGTLIINGDHALATGAITVADGAFLGGNGTLGGGLTIADGGVLDLTGATLGSNSTGILNLAGTLTLGNMTFQDLVGWDWANADLGTYELIGGNFSIDWGSTQYLSPGTAYDFGNGKSGYFTSGSLQVVVVPEPSTIALAALGMAGIGWMVQRRLKRGA
jgi:autotransporter-associated beta strand protein